MKEKIILCAIRTLGALAVFALLVGAMKWLEIDYEDVRTVLGILNSYGPEFTLLAIFAAVFYAFYKANANPNCDFEFTNFFRTGPGIHEDVGKLIYFLFGMAIMWSYFALYWKKSLTTEYVVGTGFLFIVQGVASVVGRSWGKQPSQVPPQQPGGQPDA